MPDNLTAPSTRLASLDQFRGYTMLGMLLVNFLGGFPVCPTLLKHSHDYCSYADTIMPQFVFAAGFAMRLSLGRRWQSTGQLPLGRVLRRILGLAFVAIAWYSFCNLKQIIELSGTSDLWTVLGTLSKRTWYQTLMHIAVTSLWILPVIVSSAPRRLAFAAGSGLSHIVLSWWFNFSWVNSPPAGIDGGPLGFLTWCIPAILGTLACDVVTDHGVKAVGRLIRWGCFAMLLGWSCSIPTVLYNVPADQQTALKQQKLADDPVVPQQERLRRWAGELVELPFVKPPDSALRKWNYWMMSQRAGSISYQIFAAGVSLTIYGLFLWVCDGKGWRLGLFRTLGTNSLAAYLLHDATAMILSPAIYAKSTSLPKALSFFLSYLMIVYAACRILEAKKWFLRV